MITAKKVNIDAMEVNIKGPRLEIVAEYMSITRSMIQTEVVDEGELLHIVMSVVADELRKKRA